MEKNFDLFISQLSETNATLDYFTSLQGVIDYIEQTGLAFNSKIRIVVMGKNFYGKEFI